METDLSQYCDSFCGWSHNWSSIECDKENGIIKLVFERLYLRGIVNLDYVPKYIKYIGLL